MRSFRAVSSVLVSLLFAGASGAIPVLVFGDAPVYSSNADGNYGGETYQGGLFIGGAGDGSDTRTYLTFQLPALVPGTSITSATLTGYYQDELFPDIDGVFAFYLAASDAWSEGSLTWNNQPGFVGLALASWDANGKAFGSYSFDLTAAVDAEYQGDGVLSLVFKEIDESATLTWEYWHSKEALPDPLNPAELPFQLDVTIAPVPEPATGVCWHSGSRDSRRGGAHLRPATPGWRQLAHPSRAPEPACRSAGTRGPRKIRGCPPPVEIPEAGHFVQEWGEPIARQACAAFGLSAERSR